MADKWEELTQLEAAYDALKTQPRDAQLRMLWWLSARLEADNQEAMANRRSPSPSASETQDLKNDK